MPSVCTGARLRRPPNESAVETAVSESVAGFFVAVVTDCPGPLIVALVPRVGNSPIQPALKSGATGLPTPLAGSTTEAGLIELKMLDAPTVLPVGTTVTTLEDQQRSMTVVISVHGEPVGQVLGEAG